jgi:hypothetical protein
MATGRTIEGSTGLEQTVDHSCSPVGKSTMEHFQAKKPQQGDQEKEHK